MQSGKTLCENFFNLIAKNHWWNNDEYVVIGVSAGVDSMCLLYLMKSLPMDLRPKIVVAHVNHKLRSQSEIEEQYINHYCMQNDLNVEIGIWPKSDHPTNGIENAARNFRYDFFEKVMKKYNAKMLLTAHHLNDQAETIIMKLIRGSYIKQISGINRIRKFNDGFLLRPLLDLKKASLKRFAIDNNIKWFEDETNQELDVQRNRIRHQILPMMEKENPKVVEHLGAFSKQLNQLLGTNKELLLKLIKNLKLKNDKYNLEKFTNQSDNIQFEILEELLNPVNNSSLANQDTILEIIYLLNNRQKPQVRFKLNNNYYLDKSYNEFSIQKYKNNFISLSKKDEFVVTLNQWFSTLNGELFMITDQEIKHPEKYQRISQFNLSKEDFPLSVRMTKTSDKITLKNGGHQSAKRVFINKKIPNKLRKTAQTLVSSNNAVLSIIGYSESTILNSVNKRYNLIIKQKLLEGERNE
ncbi:tRNA lysidine(34) synthetase TilS [Apilactobacillus micheneri]|uniref:tRNA lysidine(34) synthetase TilS n=1 Tax=Apilactobacillus micheneri TaxID=1899430 RepID=UPI000D5117B9|nr:tRNA lysidine(34) synthetase TilS [Apilactobacillus micheneri]GAY80197.1 tRNA(Ile)-lysidine synthase [Apilactobacillus micheneri]